MEKDVAVLAAALATHVAGAAEAAAAKVVRVKMEDFIFDIPLCFFFSLCERAWQGVLYRQLRGHC